MLRAYFLTILLLGPLFSCSYEDPINIADESLSGFSSTVKPQSFDASPTVKLNQVAARVVANHPNLRAARIRLREAEGNVVQAGLPPNPSIGLGTGKTGLGGEWDINASFSQQFPITNRLGLEKRISKLQLTMARAELADVQRRLISQSQELAVEILALRAKQKQIEAQVGLLNTVASFIEAAAKRGELSTLDGTQARVEVGKLQSEIDTLLIRQNRDMVKLKAAFGMSPNSPLALTGTLNRPRRLTARAPLGKRPDFRLKEIEEKAALAAISLEKARRFGDVTTSIEGGFAREEDAPEGLESEARIGVGLSVPLPIYNANQGNIAAAQARAERIRLERAALAIRIREQIGAAKSESDGWISLYDRLDSQLIPDASENSELLEEAFRNGQSSFISLLQARKQELELKAQLIDALESYHKSRNDYYTALGQPSQSY